MSTTLDMAQLDLRAVNTSLQAAAKAQANDEFVIENPVAATPWPAV